MTITKRIKGFYKVCRPDRMSEATIGYWDGKWWTFDCIKGQFEDDDLNWIIEIKL